MRPSIAVALAAIGLSGCGDGGDASGCSFERHGYEFEMAADREVLITFEGEDSGGGSLDAIDGGMSYQTLKSEESVVVLTSVEPFAFDGEWVSDRFDEIDCGDDRSIWINEYDTAGATLSAGDAEFGTVELPDPETEDVGAGSAGVLIPTPTTT